MTSSIPASLAMALAVVGLSPVNITAVARAVQSL